MEQIRHNLNRFKFSGLQIVLAIEENVHSQQFSINSHLKKKKLFSFEIVP